MRIIGLNGAAGSGKDTVANYIMDYDRRVEAIALADPLKDFSREVFQFSLLQLRGPSELRNMVDPGFGTRNWFWPAENAQRYAVRKRYHVFAEAFLDKVLPRSFSHDEYDVALEKLDDWLDDCLRQKYITPRYVLQKLGTEWGRAVHSNLWVNYAIRRAKTLMSNPGVPAVLITDVRFINEASLIASAGGEVWRIERPTAGLVGSAAKHASEQEQNDPAFRKLITFTIANVGTLDDLKQVTLSLYQKPYDKDPA